MRDDITDIPGLRIGHDTNLEAATGCTVIICDAEATGSVDVRGSAPATRETDLLNPIHMVDEVHAILLTGGSAFGLNAAAGVMRYLEEQGKGIDTGVARVPIVPAAAIFDLAIGSSQVRPDAEAGYRACQQANSEPLEQGNIGAGTGATVGKITSPLLAMKGGLGSASSRLPDGTLVAVLVVVNALGNIYDAHSPRIIAGTRDPLSSGPIMANPFSNTTIAVVATTATLTKAECTKVAQMAHDGLAQVVRPAHTMFDGDAIFALSVGAKDAPQARGGVAAQRVTMIGAAAAETMARAILKGVRSARTLHNIPGAQE